MAKHPADGIGWFLSLPLAHKEDLGAIRHWENLKLGIDEEAVWVKDFTPVQIDSLQVKSLPHKTIYYASGAHLFLKDSLLPHQTIPSLLWTPIERGLPLRLPSFNHNYFGVNDAVKIKLGRIGEEKEGYALRTSMAALRRYVEAAPAVRLQGLKWAAMNDGEAMILGTPLLPVPGDVFWRSGDFLFPAGYDLALPLLQETVQQILNPQSDSWIVWTKRGDYFKLQKEATTPLSIASFRKTVTS